MKTILENTELLAAWLKMPAGCRAALLERREKALHINLDTVDGYHFRCETRCYINALIDADIITQSEALFIYKVATGGDVNEQTTI